jgi:hypothetical protein
MNQSLTEFGPRPEGSFANLDTAKRYLLDWGRQHKFGAVCRGSDEKKGKPTYFQCDRSGHYRDRTDPKKAIKRKLDYEGNVKKHGTGSQKCQCPWKVAIDCKGKYLLADCLQLSSQLLLFL